MLGHGTDSFTSPPEEGMLRIFTPVKFQRLRPGLNPRSWVPEASMLTTRPPKPSSYMQTITSSSLTHSLLDNTVKQPRMLNDQVAFRERSLGYSNNCFICDSIIRKSRLIGKLTTVKLTLEQVIKVQMWSSGIALLFL